MIEQNLVSQIAHMRDKVETILEIRDNELPICQSKVAKAENMVKNLLKYSISKFSEKAKRQKMKAVIGALRRRITDNRARKHKISRMMFTLRKHHTFWHFHKFRRIVHWQV